MSLERLDDPTRALIGLATAIAMGDEAAIESQGHSCRKAAVPPLWVDELLLQSVLICGWPRALVAVRIWRHATGIAEPQEDGSDYGRHAEWAVRGERVCRTVYGGRYEALRRNVRGLHPDLDAGMITEGYGRILGRPGLHLARRELCSVAQIAILNAPRQLRSHLKGALHAGASPAAVSETLEQVRPFLNPDEWRSVTLLWERGQA